MKTLEKAIVKINSILDSQFDFKQFAREYQRITNGIHRDMTTTPVDVSLGIDTVVEGEYYKYSYAQVQIIVGGIRDLYDLLEELQIFVGSP